MKTLQLNVNTHFLLLNLSIELNFETNIIEVVLYWNHCWKKEDRLKW